MFQNPTILNCIKFVDLRIVKLQKIKMLGQVVFNKNLREHKKSSRFVKKKYHNDVVGLHAFKELE